MADDTLNIILKQKSTGTGAKDAKKSIGGLEKAAKLAAGAFAAMKAAQGAIDFVKFGAGVGRQSKALDNLAESAGTSGDAIVSAIQGASDFTINRMAAMEAANKALLMDVAKTPDEFNRITNVAVKLGRAMGQDATKSIDDFVTASARQSKQIADNLGLVVSVEDSTKKYALQLGKTSDQLTDAEKKQAFLNAMLVAGEEKLLALGETGGDAATNIEVLTAGISDAKAGLAEMAAEAVNSLVPLDELGARFRGLPETVKQLGIMAAAAVDAVEAFAGGEDAVDAFNESVRESVTPVEDLAVAVIEVAEPIEEWRVRLEEVAKAEATLNSQLTAQDWADEFANLGVQAERGMVDLADGINDVGHASAISAISVDVYTAAIEEAEEAARKTAEQQFGMVMSFKNFFDQVEGDAEDFVAKREDIEAAHQTQLAEIRARGQATAIRLDAEAEETKLSNLREKLAIALQQQTEFTEKTKESTRMAKEAQVTHIEEQISSQETLLNDYYNGRLVRQGENISSLLDAEEGRYAEELSLLEEGMAAQELAHQQSMGRMVLQSFEAWAQMKQIPADRMMEMRTAIAEEYGLIDEETAASIEFMTGQWESWADNVNLSADTVMARLDANISKTGELAGAVETDTGAMIESFDIFADAMTPQVDSIVGEFDRAKGAVVELTQDLNGIPQNIPVTVTVSTVGNIPGVPGFTEHQHGTPYFPGGMAWVGEAGPELVRLPRGARVWSAPESQRIVNNNQRTNNYNLTVPQGGVRQEIGSLMDLAGRM